MDTPISDFINVYSASAPLRLHMPGHKGIPLMGMEAADITEISGADVLYHPEGIIRQSEENAASLFGTQRTVYSTEGSSLPIRAMLYLAAMYAARKGERCVIAAGRNAHKVFITAAALLDLDVKWICPEEKYALLTCKITAARLKRFLEECDHTPTAVYITSPDYLGNITDIAAIADICHRAGILLLVDNAHGAYLNFLPVNRHPMTLGADMCCDSAHKTLPVLTGGAYLHISKNAPAEFAEEADSAMAVFASTSPSYLIMQSLDLANKYLSDSFHEKLANAVKLWQTVKAALVRHGYQLTGDEPLKLTLLPKEYGYSGIEVSDYLESRNIYCEFADPDHLVMMISPEFQNSAAERILRTLCSLPRKEPIHTKPPILSLTRQAMTAHRAMMLASEEISVKESIGRIMASPTVSCPPAIPIVSCGEIIDAQAAEAMHYYGIQTIRVLKQAENIH